MRAGETATAVGAEPANWQLAWAWLRLDWREAVAGDEKGTNWLLLLLPDADRQRWCWCVCSIFWRERCGAGEGMDG